MKAVFLNVIKRIFILVLSISIVKLVLEINYGSNPMVMDRFHDNTSLYASHTSNVTDLRIIIITLSGPNAREESCYRLLKSLQNISNEDNDRIAIDIWIDKPKPEVIITQETANKTQIFLHKLFQFKLLWKHGEFKIHVWKNHAGLRKQWIDTWHESVKHIGGLTPNLRERAVILEDDLEVSPFFWKYLKLAHNYYQNNDNIAAFTLQRASLCAAHCPKLNGGPTNIFAYRLVGSWGYSPKAKHWYKFRKWFHKNVKYTKPYVDGLTPTDWYKQKERKQIENDTMWTMHHIKYCDIDQHKDKYTIYVKCINGKTLATNHWERGLNFVSTKTARIDFPYLKQWDENIINFPNDSSLIYLGWNGKPETPIITVEELISIARYIQQKYGLVIFQTIDKNFIQMTKSWLCNIKQMSPKVLLHLILVTTDIDTYNEIKRFSIENNILFKLVLMSNNKYITYKNYKYGEYQYFKMISTRLKLENSLIQNNISLLIVESDSIWFDGDKIIENVKHLLIESDIVTYNDCKPVNRKCMCGGFIAYNPSMALRNLFEKFTYDYITLIESKKDNENDNPYVGEEGNDQVLLTKLIKQNKLINVSYVSDKEYVTGKWYERERRRKKEVIFIHNNWNSGNENKINRAKKWKHWFLSKDGKCVAVTPIRY
eukprot:326257_1